MPEISNLYKGFQTVVPASIRKKLDLDLNYVLEWDVVGEDRVEVFFRRKTRFMDLNGIVSSGKRDSVKIQRKVRRGDRIDIS